MIPDLLVALDRKDHKVSNCVRVRVGVSID